MKRLRYLWLRLRGWRDVPAEEVAAAEEHIELVRADCRKMVERANRQWDKAKRTRPSNRRRKLEMEAKALAEAAYAKASTVGIQLEFFSK